MEKTQQHLRADVVEQAQHFLRPAKILIIIPAFNEAANIARTIKEIRSFKKALSLLVVNDGSRDATGKIAAAQDVDVINLPFNLGIGGAVQTGFRYAALENFDIAVQVDGDGQHDVSCLEDLLDPLLTGEADMTIGSRFLPPHIGYRSSFVRRIGIHFFAWLISFITGEKTTDPTSGFRAYNRKMINVFSKSYPHDYPEPEAIVIAGKWKARIKEVPVTMRKRSGGSSSIRYFYTCYYMVKVTFAILLTKLKRVKDTSSC